ncbi:MAG: 30S ribosomal protein S6 [Chloroflexi bacterium]|nr:30S ribosomal protein S6 [Chloroflexota bacterium]
MREYELVMVLNPEMDEETTASVVNRVTQSITERGGMLAKQDNWGLRRLAYPIQKYREGNYVLTQFSLDPKFTLELESSLRVTSSVIRHLLVLKG